MTTRRTILAAACALSVFLLSAQKKPFHFVSKVHPGFTGPLDKGPHTERVDFLNASNLLRTKIYNPQADTVLHKSEDYIRSVAFRLPSLKFAGARTYQNEQGDGLIASWTFHEPFGEGTLIDWDTAVTTNFYFRITPPPTSASQLEDTLTQLFRLETAQLPPSVDLDTNGEQVIQFGGSWDAPRQIARSSTGTALTGLNIDGVCYLKYVIPKAVASEIYDIPPGVPERFPSLSERAKKWSTQKIFDEFAKPDLVGFYPHPRPVILAAELASRALTPQEFRSLVLNTAPEELLAGFRRAHLELDLPRRIPEILSVYESSHQRFAAYAVEEYMKYFAYEPSACSSEGETATARLYQLHRFRDEMAIYLRQCASSSAVLRMLQDDPLPPPSRDDKKM